MVVCACKALIDALPRGGGYYIPLAHTHMHTHTHTQTGLVPLAVTLGSYMYFLHRFHKGYMLHPCVGAHAHTHTHNWFSIHTSYSSIGSFMQWEAIVFHSVLHTLAHTVMYAKEEQYAIAHA